MLIMALYALVFVIITMFMMGEEKTPAEIITWAGDNHDTLEVVVMINMIANVLMIVFTVGFISRVHSIDESNAAITIGEYSALLALTLLWIGDVSQIAGFGAATKNTDSAAALIDIRDTLTWIGTLTLLGIYFIVAATAYVKKVGTRVFNGLLAIVGIVGCVGGFIPMD